METTCHNTYVNSNQVISLVLKTTVLSKKQTDCIYLDFSKAFNSVPHNESNSLWSYGLSDKLWTWFQSYLSNHSQFVSINNCSSDSLPVKSGVPQESILGPLLFIVYIKLNNLLPSIMYSNLLTFADDVKCYKAIHNFQDSHSLQLNVDSLLYFSGALITSYPLIISIIESYPRSHWEHHDLDIIFTEDLSWHSHYEATVAKVYKSLGLLKQTFKHTTSSQVKRTLYLTLVRPKLLYCSSAPYGDHFNERYIVAGEGPMQSY